YTQVGKDYTQESAAGNRFHRRLITEENLPREDEFPAFDELGGLRGLSDVTRPFAPEQMVACEECLRANAPTRMSCLYCGTALPATEQSAALRRPVLKKLEEWEQGFNVVLLPRGKSGLQPEANEEAASLLRLDAGRLNEMAETGRAMPLARAATSEEAELVLKRLGQLGIAAEVFTDEMLARQPLRVRSLDFQEDALVCRTSLEAEPHRLLLSEVALLVTGRIVTRRVEVEERKTMMGSRNKTIESREITVDEAVLDIYFATEGEAEGFRIMSGGFDYSCLGEGKALLTAENFKALVGELRRRAPSAVFDDEYARLRPLLSEVWPSAERTESLGLKRERPGRFNTEAATTFNNERQFTCYARLRSRLVLRARAESS
ncbi:MAG: hypothetical protein QOC99_1685, partial [Acidobacteriota bacterium]|nr:hypothetical protein [Acidobacteriota bacterium]